MLNLFRDGAINVWDEAPAKSHHTARCGGCRNRIVTKLTIDRIGSEICCATSERIVAPAAAIVRCAVENVFAVGADLAGAKAKTLGFSKALRTRKRFGNFLARRAKALAR